MFEEVRLPVPIVASGSFRNFSWHRVDFPSELGAALGFLSTLWAKPKSRIGPIGQKDVSRACSLLIIEVWIFFSTEFYE